MEFRDGRDRVRVRVTVVHRLTQNPFIDVGIFSEASSLCSVETPSPNCIGLADVIG